MKIPNIPKPIRNSLKHLALGITAATTFFGASPTANANLTYTFTDTGNNTFSREGWSSVYMADWAKYTWWFSDGNIGDGWSDAEAQLAHSPEFKLNGSGPLTCQIIGGPASPAATPVTAAGEPTTHSSEITAAANVGGGFMGVALRDVATDTYVLWKPIAGMIQAEYDALTPTNWPTLSFTQEQLAPYANDGKFYTLDFIDNNKSPNGEDHWATLGGASIPGYVEVVTRTYAFHDGTLQGWHNRVWDATATAWIDLAPNAVTMPANVNGGVIQPPHVDNYLFANNGSQIMPLGATSKPPDVKIYNRLNTLWMRSRVFQLEPTKDLTVQIGGGSPSGYAIAPANDESVPSAADANGWKGVALRTVSDGAFVLTKACPSADTLLQDVTFTASELSPYLGIDCTLELINLDNGAPGWLSIDNISIPTISNSACDMLTYGTDGVINGTDVILFVPYGTDLSTLTPACTVSPDASYVGPTPSFSVSNPSNYVVTAQNGTTKTYTATIMFGTISTACDIQTFTFPGQLDTVISGTNISVTVPMTTDVTALAPTYTMSAFANGSTPSGSAQDFTQPRDYTITAQNGITTKTYTVTVTKGPVPSIFTWSGGVTGDWSDSTKWTNDLATGSRPATTGQDYYTLNFTAGTYTATQDLSAGFLANQLNFGAAVTINGANSLALTANGAVLPTVNQNSSSAVAIDTPVSLAAMTTVVGTSNGQVTLSGAITGAGGLTKSNSGVLKLYGFSPASNTYSGGTIINNGILQLGEVFNGSTPICANPMGSGPVTLNSGAMIQCNRVTAANALTVNGGTLANYNGWGTTWSGSITMNATLMVHTAGYTELTGTISGAGGITKTGGAKLLVSGVNTYTGDTTVNEGTLLVKSDSIMNTNKLVIGGGKVAATGTLSVNTLFFGATQQAAGTWGATGSGATHIDDTHFANTVNDQNVVLATGVVNVLAGTVVNDYETWASTFPGFTNTGATADPDGDGMSNQQEYAFGLNPTTGSSVNPISSPLSGNAFSYTRRLNSGLVYTVWHSMNLETWDSTGATEGTPTVNGSVETVPVTLDPLLINESKLFIRVSAAEPAPAP